LWRYLELLPVEEPRTGFNSGFTPLVRATRLAKELGLSELYIKDDSVNHPTFSYKDRVVSVAATKAVELNFPVFSCASTGNLAGSVAAHAARLGLPCYVFIPYDLEPAKILGAAIYRPHVVAVEGNYDDVNRLCTQIADRYGWGFANINLRAYYAEGAKTMGFEIAEQLGWRYPDHIVSPVAGGTLLPRIYKGLREFREIGLVQGTLPRIHAAQPTGSAPVVRAPATSAGRCSPRGSRPRGAPRSSRTSTPAASSGSPPCAPRGAARAPKPRPASRGAGSAAPRTVQYNAKAPRSLIDRRQRELDGRRPGNGPEESPGTVGQGAG